MSPRVTEDPPRVDVAVVIVTYNSAAHLPELLASIDAASRNCSTRVVVVDNGSSDTTVDIARATAGVICVESEANLGYAGGLNVGRANAGPRRAVLILNPDLRVRPDTIEVLLEALASPGVGAVVPRLLDEHGTTHHSLRRDPGIARAVGDALFGDHLRPRSGRFSEQVDEPGAYTTRHPIEWATGAAIMVSDDCDTAVGAWDESYFMYSEEIDYALRIRDAGYRILYVPEADAIHSEGGSGRSDALTALLALNRVRLHRSRHGRWSNAIFRLVVATHELSRFWKPERRHSAAVVLGLAAPPRFDGAAPIATVPW